jgi:hypothetical protein
VFARGWRVGWAGPRRPPVARRRARLPSVETMSEIVFLVEEDPDGGLTARALGESIFTQGDDLEALKEALRDAVRCHFANEDTRPRVIRLHSVRDEVIAL